MSPHNRRRIGLLSLFAVALVSGCVHSAGYELLSLIGLSQKPVVIALVAGMPKTPTNPVEAIDPFGPYVPLCKALSAEIDRPVVPDLCLPIQLEGNMQLGICHLASVSAIDYARLSNPEAYSVLAVSSDEQGRAQRRGLLVVRSESPIREVLELKGKVVAFGPDRDARLNQAGLQLLASKGVQRTDLSLDPLPIPGSLRIYAKSRDIAQAVTHSSADAGFVDEAYWESLPDAPTAADEPSKSKLRVIAKTQPVAERLIIASTQVDAALQTRIAKFLTTLDEQHPETLRSLSCASFVPPADEVLAACRALAATSASPQ